MALSRYCRGFGDIEGTTLKRLAAGDAALHGILVRPLRLELLRLLTGGFGSRLCEILRRIREHGQHLA
jgi:hypothetical protein